MPTTSLMPVPKQQFFAVAGIPLSGGKIYTYAAGTTNPKTTYTDAAGTTAQANPIVLNARGEPANPIFWSGSYYVEIKDALGNLIYNIDNFNTDPAGVWGLKAELATSAGAPDIGFLQAGANAALRTVQDELCDTVKYSQFVQPGDVSAHQALQRAHDMLPGTGGTIEMPLGFVTATAGIVVTKNLRLKGKGRFMSGLKCTGNNGGQPFIKQTAGDVLGFEDMTFEGNGTTAGPIADAGSIGFQAFNNSYSQNAEFTFWETLATYNGGYYHKHFNSFFEYCKTFFSGYAQNNVGFFGCRWSNFQNGMTIASGEGPISFVGGSIEYFADKAFQSTLGRQVSLSMFGVYVENGATAACPVGIVSPNGSGKFDHGVIIYSNGTEIYPFTMMGCVIFTPGIFRLAYMDSAIGCSVIAKGNTFVARGVASGPPDTIYSLSGTNVTCDLHDEIIGALPAGTVYVGGYPANLEGCTIFDPVNRAFLRPTQSWTAATMQNGWTNASNAGYTLDRTGRLQLRGTVNGGAATSQVIFTLPANLVPAVGKFYVTSYNGGFVGLRVLATGAVYLDAAVSGAMNGINLDCASFYVGS